MNIKVRINGVWVAVEASEEVCQFLMAAKRKEENLRHEQRRHWDRHGFDKATLVIRHGDYACTPEQWFLHNEMIHEIQTAMAQCTPTQRKLLLMYAIGGYSYGDIARMMGCSKSTVYDAIQAARKKCRRNFQKHPND